MTESSDGLGGDGLSVGSSSRMSEDLPPFRLRSCDPTLRIRFGRLRDFLEVLALFSDMIVT